MKDGIHHWLCNNVGITSLGFLLRHPGELCKEQPHGVLHGAQLVGAAEAQQVGYELIRQLQRSSGSFALPTLQLAVGI